MNFDRLKQLLINKALKGELVPQDDSEPSIPSILASRDAFPFTIPDKWGVMTLNDVSTKITDGEHKTPKYLSKGVPFLSVKDISSGHISFANTKYISEEACDIYRKRCNPEKGDVLVSKVGTTGVPAIVDTDQKFSLFVSIALIKPNHSLILNTYLYFIIQSDFLQNHIKKTTRGLNKNWVIKEIAATVIPVPPLAEQHRIVDRLNELLAVIKKAEDAYTDLQSLGKTLRERILQKAIEGKLVPQLEEEPAVEQIGEIHKELPFTIPQKWKWIQLKSLVTKTTQKIPDKKFAYIDVSSINPRLNTISKTTSLDPSEAPSRARKVVSEGMVLFSTVRPYLKNICIAKDINSETIASTAFATFSCNIFLLNEFMLAVLTSSWFMDYVKTIQKGISYPAISEKDFYSSFIPVPPLAEQRRIVAKLNELLPLVDQMTAV